MGHVLLVQVLHRRFRVRAQGLGLEGFGFEGIGHRVEGLGFEGLGSRVTSISSDTAQNPEASTLEPPNPEPQTLNLVGGGGGCPIS